MSTFFLNTYFQPGIPSGGKFIFIDMPYLGEGNYMECTDLYLKDSNGVEWPAPVFGYKKADGTVGAFVQECKPDAASMFASRVEMTNAWTVAGKNSASYAFTRTTETNLQLIVTDWAAGPINTPTTIEVTLSGAHYAWLTVTPRFDGTYYWIDIKSNDIAGGYITMSFKRSDSVATGSLNVPFDNGMHTIALDAPLADGIMNFTTNLTDNGPFNTIGTLSVTYGVTPDNVLLNSIPNTPVAGNGTYNYTVAGAVMVSSDYLLTLTSGTTKRVIGNPTDATQYMTIYASDNYSTTGTSYADAAGSNEYTGGFSQAFIRLGATNATDKIGYVPSNVHRYHSAGATARKLVVFDFSAFTNQTFAAIVGQFHIAYGKRFFGRCIVSYGDAFDGTIAGFDSATKTQVLDTGDVSDGTAWGYPGTFSVARQFTF